MSFILFAICVIQNAFIIIIEDGYIRARYTNKNEWYNSVIDDTVMGDHNPIIYEAILGSNQKEEIPINEDEIESTEVKLKKKEIKSKKALVTMLMADKIDKIGGTHLLPEKMLKKL